MHTHTNTMSPHRVPGVGPDAGSAMFHCRFSPLCLCDPAPRGVPGPAGEPGLHLLLGSVCLRTLPPAGRPLSGRQPFWEAIPHSLQPAETIRPRPCSGARFPGSGPGSRQPGPLPGPAAARPAALPAVSAAVSCAAAGAGPWTTAAVSHQTSPAGGDGEKPATPPGSAAGQCDAGLSCVGLCS